ncbi:hypothetical protein HZS_238 [Henneguya salminicola]|nr:hypothetical protein HZS_238 [Henneguya salminicola]
MASFCIISLNIFSNEIYEQYNRHIKVYFIKEQQCADARIVIITLIEAGMPNKNLNKERMRGEKRNPAKQLH